MVGVLHRRDMGKEGFAHHAAVDRLFGRRRLNHRALASPATVTRTDDPLHPILNRNDVEHLLLRLADLVQTAATAWAALVGDVDDHINARQMRRQTAAVAIGARPYRRPERGGLLFSFVLAGARASFSFAAPTAGCSICESSSCN